MPTEIKTDQECSSDPRGWKQELIVIAEKAYQEFQGKLLDVLYNAMTRKLKLSFTYIYDDTIAYDTTFVGTITHVDYEQHLFEITPQINKNPIILSVSDLWVPDTFSWDETNECPSLGLRTEVQFDN